MYSSGGRTHFEAKNDS
jgi:hypothetical protein